MASWREYERIDPNALRVQSYAIVNSFPNELHVLEWNLSQATDPEAFLQGS
jgi:hypothetical protein